MQQPRRSRRAPASWLRSRLRTGLRLGVLAVLAVPPLLALTGVAAIPAVAPAVVPTPPPAAKQVHEVVALGDSVPAGAACDCDEYAQLLARDLAARQRHAVTSTNLAVGGATTADVAAQLADRHTRAALADADVVVVTVGANDVESDGDPTDCADAGAAPDARHADAVVAACYRQQLADLQADLDTLLDGVRSLANAPGRRILVTGYWSVFLDGAPAQAKGPAYVALARAATTAVNARIAAAAGAHGATYVDLVPAFHGDDGTADPTPLLAADGDHPDARGHAVIADALLAALN